MSFVKGPAGSYRNYPLGMNILSFAKDDKLRPGEDVTSATGMTKFR